MATMKDIAQAAGVSYATVSNVLNKRPGVSYEKIRLVEETARAMGYRFDESASLLRKGRSNIIVIIIPDITTSKYTDLYAGILNTAEQEGYQTRLHLTDNEPYSEKEAIENAVSARACAILAVSSCKDTHAYYDEATQANIPILFLERLPSDPTFPSLVFDVKQAADHIAAFLQNQDHSNLLIATDNTQYSSESVFRDTLLATFKEAECLENIQGELSDTFYLPFLDGKSPSLIVCSNEQLVESLQHTAALLVRDQEPSFVTLSSKRIQENHNIHSVALNYRYMGAKAVNIIHRHLEEHTKLISETMSVSSLSGGKVPTIPLRNKHLHVVSLYTPSAEALRCLAPMFTKMTGYDVTIDTYTQSEIFEQIQQRSETPWDVIRMDVSSFPYLAPQLLVPLKEIDPTVEESLFPTLIAELKEPFSVVEDTLYAVPFDISVQMLFYRRDLYEDIGIQRAFLEQTGSHLSIPKTYEEYDDLARFFTRSIHPDSPTKYGTSIALGNPSSTASDFLPRLLSAVKPVYNKQGRLQFAGAESILALENYLQLTNYARKETVHSWGEVVDQFLDGDISSSILYLNHAARVVRTQNTDIAGIVGFSTVPGQKPLLGGGVLGISQQSKQQEAAYEFIRWAVSDKIASELMMMGGISPCKSAYEQRLIIEHYPWLSILEENISLGGRRNILFQDEAGIDQHQIEIDIGNLIKETVAGKRTAEESIWKMQFLINEANT